MPSTLASAAKLVSRALMPVTNAVTGSDENLLGFVEQLGWTLPTVPGAFQDVRTAATAVVGSFANLEWVCAEAEIGSETEDALLAAEAKVLLDIGVLAAAIAQIPDKLKTQLPPGYLAATNIANEFNQRLFDYARASDLDDGFPLARRVLSFLGILERIEEPESSSKYQPEFTHYWTRWERFPQLFKDPAALLKDVYGWGTPNLDVDRLFAALLDLSMRLSAPAEIQYPSDALLANVAPNVVIAPDVGPEPMFEIPLIKFDMVTVSLAILPLPKANAIDLQGLALTLVVSGDVSKTIDLSPSVSLSAETAVDLSTGFAIVLLPGQLPRLSAGALSANAVQLDGRVSLKLIYSSRSDEPSRPRRLLSIPGGSRLEVKSIVLKASGEGHSTGGFDVSFELGVLGGKVVITAAESDGFLAKILPKDGLEVDFEFGLGWSKSRGVYFQGSAGLEAEIGLHTSIGPFQLDSLHLAIAAAAAGLKLETSLVGKGVLGPVTASVERIGLSAHLDFKPGNLGPVEAGVDFKPPSGLGIVVDASVVTGGGFITFDPPNGRYAGGIELKIEEIIVKAYCLLDTKLPDGKPGFSFLILITAEFTPMQLGFGFTLDGVGGLAGINRTLVLDALQAGFRAHSINSILFPDIHNAQKIVSDLRAIFPPAEGRYVFGPMVKIGWGSPNVVVGEIGIVLEVPAPIRLAILGLIVATLPEDDDEDTVVLIHLDVLGIIDFGLKKLAIDAMIYDSRVVAFSLFGDMALRLSWGADATFAFSLGGLHPQYQPPPAFPHLRRLTLSLGAGDNPRLSLTTYMAVTSNTVQFGADLELYVAYGGFKAHGYLAFDALFIISPFSFTTEMRAGIDVQYNGVSLCGISLDFILTGPTPWTYSGTVTLHILFFDVSVGVSGSFGGGIAKPLPAEPVMTPLLKALNDPRCWTGVLPDGASRGVSFVAPKPDDTTIYVHPIGQLTVRETVVPLSTPITKFGSAVPSDGDRFDITTATLKVSGSTTTEPTTDVTDPFARAQFEEMKDGEKLSAKSYEPFTSGVTLGDLTIEAGNPSTLDLHYDTQIIDDVFMPSRVGDRYQVTLDRQNALCRQGAGELSQLRSTGNAKYKQRGMTSPIATPVPGFVITSIDDLSIRYDITGGEATTQRAASVQLEDHLARNPQDTGRFQIMPVHEVAV
jgi:hypothetical protein